MGHPANDKATLEAIFKAFNHAKDSGEDTVVQTCKGDVRFKPGLTGVKVQIEGAKTARNNSR